MRCLICRRGETRAGTTSVTLERRGATLVLKIVPAQVCPNCGEAYVDEAAAKRLLLTAEQMAQEGTAADTRQ